MVGNPFMEAGCGHANWQQPFALCRDCHACNGMGVQYAVCVIPGAVDSAVDNKTWSVYSIVAGSDGIAIQVDLNQVGGSYLIVTQTVGVY